MAKQLAIEWDEKEIRVLAARPRGTRFSVTDAFALDIAGIDPSEVGDQLSKELASRGLQKLATLVAIGRSRAELRQLSLPAIPDEELPDVVRFQAVRQFASSGERSLVDFLSIERSESNVEVAAAAVAPEHLETIREVCRPAELEIERVVLRPTAAAALFKLVDKADANRETILIDTLAEELDLVVIRDNSPAFLRSVRIPQSEPDRARVIVSEVRRSLMAARRDNDESVDRKIIVWGRKSVHSGLIQSLAEDLQIDVEAIDPFSLVDTSDDITKDLHEHVGRFAPLLGLLEGHALSGEGLIDFLNPRKRPEPKNNRDRYLLYGGLAAACIFLLLGSAWWKMHSLDSKYAAKLKESNELTEVVDAAGVSRTNLQRIDAFLDGDVFVLGELANLSDNLAPAGSMQVDQLTISVEQRGGAKMTVKGVVKDASLVAKMESRLRDDNHEVTGDGVKGVLRREPYKFQFDDTIRVPASSIRTQRLMPPKALGAAEEEATDDSAETVNEVAEDAGAQEAVEPAETVTPDEASSPEDGETPEANDSEVVETTTENEETKE